MDEEVGRAIAKLLAALAKKATGEEDFGKIAASLGLTVLEGALVFNHGGVGLSQRIAAPKSR